MWSWPAPGLRRFLIETTPSQCRRAIQTKAKPALVKKPAAHETIDDELDKELATAGTREDAIIEKAMGDGALDAAESDSADLTPEDVYPPFTKAFTKVDGSVRTHRWRRHENRALPLSPVIDPVFIAARNRWKMKKRKPLRPDEMTDFQKKLAINPYAKALATPLRTTTTSETALPRFFLLPLDLRRSPNPPHNPTFVPTKLWAETVGTLTAETGPMNTTHSYVDLCQPYIKTLDAMSDKKASAAVMGVAHSMKFDPYSEVRNSWGMPGDMGRLVLELLRGGVVKPLTWLMTRRTAGLVEECHEGANAVRERSDVACVLYTGPMYPDRVRDDEAEVQYTLEWAEGFAKTLKRHQRRPKSSSLLSERMVPLLEPGIAYPAPHRPFVRDAEGKAVPVYSLSDMLGEEKTRELLGSTYDFKGARCVVVKDGDRRTVEAQMGLLRLANYLALGQVGGKGLEIFPPG